MLRAPPKPVNVRRVRIKTVNRDPDFLEDTGTNCPECGDTLFVWVDPDDGPELLCPSCVCFAVARW